MGMPPTPSKLSEKHDFALDRIIAILGLVLSLAFVVIFVGLGYSRIYIVYYILTAVFIPCLFYLIFRKKLLQAGALPEFQGADQIRCISHSFFIISLALSIWLLWSNLYYRPPLYFALLLIAAASVILDIFCLNETKGSHIFIVLVKIVTLSLTVYAGIYYQFPGIYGGWDPMAHNAWIQETVNSGHITIGEFVNNSYYLFPVFHLAGAMTQITIGLSTHNSIFASTSIFMAVSSIFVFLIGRKLVNIKTGLLAALIVSLSDYVIERATAITPNSLGFFFFAVILYLIFSPSRKGFSNTFLIILVSVSLILTHTISAFVMLLSLITIFVGIKWHKWVNKQVTVHGPVSLILVVLFGMTMLTVWMQNPPVQQPFFDMNIRNLARLLQSQAGFVLASPPEVTTTPDTVLFLDHSCCFLLIAVGLIGGLIYLHPRNCTGFRAALIFTAAVLIAIAYGFILSNTALGIVSWRWYIFIYAPLSVLAAQGVLSISSLIKRNIGNLSMVTFIMLAVIFLTTTNSIANDDSPMVFNGARRAGYTESELTAIKTLSGLGAGCPITDLLYGATLPSVIDYDEYLEMVRRDNEIFIERNYYLHHPEWNEGYTDYVHEGALPHHYGEHCVQILDYARQRGIDKGPLIYTSGNVKVYAITKAE